MKTGEENILIAFEKAIEFIRKLSEEEIKTLINNESYLVLMQKSESVDRDGENRDSRTNGTGRAEETSYNQRRCFTKKSEYQSDKEKKTDSQKEKRSSKSSFEKIEELNEFDIYIRELSRFRDIDEARKYLLKNKLTVTKLKILAKKLSIHVKSKAKKIEIIDTIVEGTVGSFLKFEALRNY